MQQHAVHASMPFDTRFVFYRFGKSKSGIFATTGSQHSDLF
jgi:hypothetical protein